MHLMEIDPKYHIPGRDLFCGTAAKPGEDYKVRGFSIVRCQRCGLVWSHPRIAQEYLFEQVYVPEYADALKRPPSTRPWYKRLWLALRARFTHSLGKRWTAVSRLALPDHNVSFLEVGCWTGGLLETIAQQRPHWRVKGLEPADTAVEEARRKGLDVAKGFLEDNSLPADSFDILVAYHVLEHTPDPREFLAAAKRVLRTGGRCIFHCPNYASLRRRMEGGRWRDLSPEQHVYHFTPQTLSRLMEEVGANILYLTGGLANLASRMHAVVQWPD